VCSSDLKSFEQAKRMYVVIFNNCTKKDLANIEISENSFPLS